MGFLLEVQPTHGIQGLDGRKHADGQCSYEASTLVGLALEMQPTHKIARVSMAIISMRGHTGRPFFQSSSSP